MWFREPGVPSDSRTRISWWLPESGVFRWLQTRFLRVTPVTCSSGRIREPGLPGYSWNKSGWLQEHGIPGYSYEGDLVTPGKSNSGWLREPAVPGDTVYTESSIWLRDPCIPVEIRKPYFLLTPGTGVLWLTPRTWSSGWLREPWFLCESGNPEFRVITFREPEVPGDSRNPHFWWPR